jgi:hypothetical protein
VRVSIIIFLGELLVSISGPQPKIIGYQKLKHNKPWFDVKCSILVEQRKQAKLQQLQNPEQINGFAKFNL